MRRRLIIFLIVLSIAFIQGTSYGAEPIYPDFSKATCEVSYGSGGWKIVVHGAEIFGYGFWMSNYWNPLNLSFDLMPKGELGIEHYPPAPGTKRCSFVYQDASGRQARVDIETVDRNTLKLSAEPLNGSIFLCLNNTHAFVNSGGISYLNGNSTAGNNWGGCGDLVPGNTYQGLLLFDYYSDQHPGWTPDFTQPFSFYYQDDTLATFGADCT